MNSIRIDTAACKALLVAGSIAAGVLIAGPACAASLDIVTNGTIASGTDPGNLFGAGASLTGASYTLSVEFDGLGPNYFTDGSGFSAMDIDPLTGFVTVSVNGHTPFTSDLTQTTAALLAEDLFDINEAFSGTDAASNYTSVTQGVTGNNSSFVPFADLQTEFSYLLQNGDFGNDTYLYTDAANDPSTSFIGTPTSVQLLVPEPETWALMATGLLGLGLLARRRRA